MPKQFNPNLRIIIAVIHLCGAEGLLVVAAQGRASYTLSKPCAAFQTKNERISNKIHEKGVKDANEEDRFITNFVRLPPEDRVKLWRTGKDVTGRGLMPPAMEDALIADGVDAVPFLANVVRSKDSYYSVYALKILCDMDRFVPLRQLVVCDFGGSVYVKPLKLEGRIDPFRLVNGRRIGKAGYEVVMWAANQTGRSDLSFHAREYSGLLEQDLRQLSLDEQLKKWRNLVAGSNGILGMFRKVDDYNESDYLAASLVEKAPASIPPLLDLLEKDSSDYVREALLSIIWQIDSCRVRLRAIDEGRAAIQAIKRAIERGRFKPAYDSDNAKIYFWQGFSALVFKDEFPLDNSSHWALIAAAFEKLYGASVTRRYRTIQTLTEATPEMREFITYLTNVDPYFPSWEYTYSGNARDEVFHPRFKNKIARYYEQWLRFKGLQK